MPLTTAAGLNAAFNLNLFTASPIGSTATSISMASALRLIQRRAGGLYIRSRKAQTATIAGLRFPFAEGESIHTENSYKYAIPEFRALAERAGFRTLDTWTDRDGMFGGYYLPRA